MTQSAKNILLSILGFIGSVLFIGLIIQAGSDMSRQEKYMVEVEYSHRIVTEIFVPDSLMDDYRIWITETVRAASQHVTGGDYEDVHETIRQVEITGERIFGKKELCLSISYNSDYNNIVVRQKDMTKEQRQIFQQLLKEGYE